MNALPSEPSPRGSISQIARSAPAQTTAVTHARPSDHLSAVRFLSSVCPGWPASRLKASFDDPLYEPRDRLLIRAGTRLIGHAHTTQRVMQFGAIRLPVSEVQWVLVAPELRRQGLGRKLLDAAARHMSHQDSLIGLVRTSAGAIFEKLGWGLVGVDHRSTISTRLLLSEMFTQDLLPEERRCRVNVRPCRRLEIEAIERIYNRNLPGTFGPMERTAATWQWIVDRDEREQLYVAASGPASVDAEESRSEILAYALVRGGRILELLTTPGRRAAAVPLLARLCREAMEKDRSQIVLHAPPDDHLHSLFRLAGGRTEDRQPDGGQVLMARVLAPAKLLRQMEPELLHRAEDAGLKLPFQWSIGLDRRGYLVTVDARGVTVTAGRHDEHWFCVAGHDLAPLVLGQLDWAAACKSGRVIVSGNRMRQAGSILFPRFSLWCPPLDSLAALL
ncbi:MAG: GNAT family N-acetyltransferase [Pirellulales bacterium]|nr:GNAT family N-acetyltransferase [Pirellulales bacterium]